MKMLEIGPGTVSGASEVFPTADTVDILGDKTTYKAAWGYEKLPIESDSYDFVFASHVLEHIPWMRVGDALKEVYRVLRPGGTFEVYVPNFAYVVQCYLDRKCGDSWRVHNASSDYMQWVNGRVFSYGEDCTSLLSEERPIPQTYHKAVFDADHLTKCLTKSGFVGVTQLHQRLHGRSHGPIDLGFTARKD